MKTLFPTAGPALLAAALFIACSSDTPDGEGGGTSDYDGGAVDAVGTWSIESPKVFGGDCTSSPPLQEVTIAEDGSVTAIVNGAAPEKCAIPTGGSTACDTGGICAPWLITLNFCGPFCTSSSSCSGMITDVVDHPDAGMCSLTFTTTRVGQ
jgi:hypothetical protein